MVELFIQIHYGRDALVGVNISNTIVEENYQFLELRKTYPNYFISKNKIELKPEIDVNRILEFLKKK